MREAVGMLCMLALVFLNFGHAPAGLSVSYAADLTPYFSTGADLCLDGAPAPDHAHAPCHACRIGAGADLPPPPCVAAPAFRLAVEAAYAEPAALPPRPTPLRQPSQRAPPRFSSLHA